MSIFSQVKIAGPLFTEVGEGGDDGWVDVDKTLHIGHANKASAHSYNNIVIKTLPSDESNGDGKYLSKLEIDLTDVDSEDGSLTVKLRKVKICDDNGNNGYVYMLCSEAFGGDAGFVPPEGLG
jgi:hypothetical protein